MTSFSTKEEKQEEPGEDNVLGGFVRFYPDEALDGAMGYGKVLVRGQKWQNNVIQHKELITGANPFSDTELGEKFLNALLKKSGGKPKLPRSDG